MIANRSTPELEALVHLFYPSLSDLGEFTEVDASDMPPVYRDLLAHDKHMTVTVEAHHGCAVDVNVLRSTVTKNHYSREILLTRQSDDRVIQFGIVRLTLHFLAEDVRREIESERIPLGRVLIAHDVMRTVRLLSLWKILPSESLRGHLGLAAGEFCYGRTALLYCDKIPAVELLEIVADA